MDKELIMYGRQYGCIDQFRAINFLEAQGVPYRFVDVSKDQVAAKRLEQWVGHQSVPTMIIAAPGQDVPVAEPAPVDRSRRLRGQDRGTLITEPSDEQLADFLRAHGLL